MVILLNIAPEAYPIASWIGNRIGVVVRMAPDVRLLALKGIISVLPRRGGGGLTVLTVTLQSVTV